VKGGYLEVSYVDGDTTVYLPVGETVKVPKGTTLDVKAELLDYELSDSKSIISFLQSWSVNGENRPLPRNPWDVEKVTADKDVTLDAVFKGHAYEHTPFPKHNSIQLSFVLPDGEFFSETGMYDEGKLPAYQLTMYDFSNDINLGWSDVKDLVIESWEYYGDGEENPYDSNPLNIDKKGVLTSSTVLKKGDYTLDVSYLYKGEPGYDRLDVSVGTTVGVNIPLVRYEYSEKSKSFRYGHNRGIGVTDINSETFQSIYQKYMVKSKNSLLAGHEATGLGTCDINSGEFKSLMSTKVKSRVREYSPYTSVRLICKGYTVPMVAHLDESDIVPEKVNPGWNQLGGKDYYYETDDPASLVTNAWVNCKDKDGEQVWVGKDGTMVTDSVVKDGDDSYLVDAAGHKIKGKTTTKNGVDYITDNEGKITETKVHLATPSNAAEATAQVDRVLANRKTMAKPDIAKAAYMLTESLTKKKVDASKLTAAEIAKYEEVYKAAFDIDVEMDEAANAVSSGAILAAGITYEDAKDGSVSIKYSSAWKASSSNAQERVLIQLFVNGKERTTLAAPIKITITEMPEAFIASYSNAKYNYEIADAKDVTLDTDKGVLTMTVSRTGIFNIKATLKPTKKPSGGGGGTYTSLGGGSRSVKTNGYKNGQWVRNDKGWWYKYEDGTWPANAWLYLPWKNEYKWYFFNAEGYMATGWLYWKDNYYYLYPYADGDCGYMFTGWHEIGGKWYYFYEQNDAGLGTMAYNTYTPDGYKVDASGAWIK